MTQSGGGIGDYSGVGWIPRPKWDKFKAERLKDPEVKAAYDEAVARNRELDSEGTTECV